MRNLECETIKEEDSYVESEYNKVRSIISEDAIRSGRDRRGTNAHIEHIIKQLQKLED